MSVYYCDGTTHKTEHAHTFPRPCSSGHQEFPNRSPGDHNKHEGCIRVRDYTAHKRANRRKSEAGMGRDDWRNVLHKHQHGAINPQANCDCSRDKLQVRSHGKHSFVIPVARRHQQRIEQLKSVFRTTRAHILLVGGIVCVVVATAFRGFSRSGHGVRC